MRAAAPVGGWTARSVLRRAREVLRDDGLRALWFKVLGETVYRRVSLVRLPIDPPPPLTESTVDTSFGFVGPDEIDALTRLRPDVARKEVERRLARGDRCWAARRNGDIVSTRWVASGSAWIEYLGVEVPLRPDEVFLYETYTAPAYRGLGLSPAAGTRLTRALRAEGWMSILGGVVPENAAALRAASKTGYREVGSVGVVRLGPRRRALRRRERRER